MIKTYPKFKQALVSVSSLFSFSLWHRWIFPTHMSRRLLSLSSLPSNNCNYIFKQFSAGIPNWLLSYFPTHSFSSQSPVTRTPCCFSDTRTPAAAAASWYPVVSSEIIGLLHQYFTFYSLTFCPRRCSSSLSLATPSSNGRIVRMVHSYQRIPLSSLKLRVFQSTFTKSLKGTHTHAQKMQWQEM